MSGGLGNQMFQYALFFILKGMNIEVRIDFSSYKYINEHNGIEIYDYFDLKPTEYEKEIVSAYKRREKIVNFIFKIITIFHLNHIVTKWKLRHIIRFRTPKLPNFKRYHLDKDKVNDIT